MNKNILKWKNKNKRTHYWLTIPLEWYTYFKEEDFQYIENIHKESIKQLAKLWKSHDEKNISDTEYHRENRRIRGIASHKKSNFRKIIRKRRCNSFASGMYIVRTGTVWFYPVAGKYNYYNFGDGGSWGDRPKKSDVITWIETDELDRQIFMFRNRMFSAHGASLDGLSRI